MIVTIKGILTHKELEEVIIDINGLGYACFISTNTYDSLPNEGEQIFLFTYFHVTENNQQLFAFSNITERELFMMLIGVSGIGPKTAIVLLSSVTPDEFKNRLIAGEVGMLTELPGIGPKTARRIIVELKDKFVKLDSDDLPKEDLDLLPELNDASNALLSLGYNIQEIRSVLNNIKDNNKEMNTEEIIKKALLKLK